MMLPYITSWNCEGLSPKWRDGDIPHLIKQTGANILVFQETKQAPGSTFKIKGFKGYQQNLNIQPDQIPHGGVAVYVKNFISSYRIDLQTTLQAVAVSIKIHKRITVCSIYLPPGEIISKQQLQNLVDQLPKPFLLLGDMNAHHPMWYDPRGIDDRGETIVDLIADNDLALLDQNKMTSIWKVDKSFSHIDLSICSVELLTWFQWDVYEEPLNSDHFPILLKSGTQRNQGGAQRWIMSKADWQLYNQSTEIDRSVTEFSSVEEAANFFENHVKEAATKAIPKTKGTGKRRSPPWWNGQCRAAIWKRKAAFRRYRKATTSTNYNKYSKARAEAKRTVKQSKKASWEEFINGINRNTTTKEVWKKIGLLNNRYKSTCVNTLILNKEVRIANIPTDHAKQLIKELCEMGCVQTLKTNNEENGCTTLLVRFESDSVTDRALQLDGVEVQGHKLKAALTINPQEHQLVTTPDVLDEPKDIADCLGKRFSYVSSGSSADPSFKEHKQQAEQEDLDFSTEENMDYNSPVSMQELEYALKLAKDSSPGPDEICYSMLQNLAPSGKNLLLDLLNRIFSEGKFPENWKEAHIIPILKEGKPETSAGSYRPIALTSCVCKLFERILNRRLIRFLESKGLTDIYQSGFRRGRSTLDCLAKLTTEIHNAYRKKQYYMCVFFDLEKAYDTCWKHLIMKQLHKFGLRGNLPIIIQDFLSNRNFRVKVEDQLSDVYEQENGTPQGGVLSCPLFSIGMNTVVKEIRGLISYSMYVDDKQVGVAGSSPSSCRQRIQQTLDVLDQWSLKTGFRFSIDKTVYMLFYRHLLEPAPLTLTLGGKTLKEVVTKKYLGLILDRMLTFKQHVAYLRGRCLRDMNILRIVSRANCATDSILLLRIYRALIRPKLDYACEIYGTAKGSYLTPLDPVHHKGIRICLGAYRTSPFESMYVEANEPSLSNRRQMLQLQYYVRMKQFMPGKVPVRLDDASLDGEYARPSSKPTSLGYTVRQSVRDLGISLPHIALLTEGKLGPWEIPKPDICLRLAGFPKKSTSAEQYEQYFLQHKHKTDMDIYTDGSKSDSGVGAGVVAMLERGRDSAVKRRLHDTASIFTAELYAIKIALFSIKHSQAITCAVYTDSRSALQAIQGQSRCNLVQEILELLVMLSKKEIKIIFCWLPGHCNIPGNEKADKEAKAAVDLPIVSSQEIPLSDVKTYIKKKMREKIKRDWTLCLNERGEDPKLKEICPDIKGTPINIGLSRKDTMKLVRLRLGHTRVTHSYYLTGDEMPWCVECETPMSVKHILLECGNCAQERYNYYDPRDVTLRTLLTQREYVLKVLAFLKEIGWDKKL